jgi:hypothetical protein
MNNHYGIFTMALAGLLGLGSLAHAGEVTRPRIGLVLGGGARGAAHIGGKAGWMQA